MRFTKGAVNDLTNNLLLCNEPSELILALFGEFAQLDTLNLSTNVCGEVNSGGAIQEIRKAGIGIFSMVVVLKGFKWGISNYSVSSRSENKTTVPFSRLVSPGR